MSDPSKLEFGDWFAAIVTSMVAGVGAAMAWFKSSNEKRDAKIGAMEERMGEFDKVLQAHTTLLAVAQNTQESIDGKLEEIKEDIRRSAEAGAHSVNTQIAQVLSEVQVLAAAARQRERRP